MKADREPYATEGFGPPFGPLNPNLGARTFLGMLRRLLGVKPSLTLVGKLGK